MLRLERRDSRRDLTTGRAVGPPQDPIPVWTTRLTGASPAARSHNSSMTAGSSVGREERLHVDGRGVFTSSRISSLDLGGLSGCPAPLPPGLSSRQRVSFSMLPMAAGLPSDATTERPHTSKKTVRDAAHYFTFEQTSVLLLWASSELTEYQNKHWDRDLRARWSKKQNVRQSILCV